MTQEFKLSDFLPGRLTQINTDPKSKVEKSRVESLAYQMIVAEDILLAAGATAGKNYTYLDLLSSAIQMDKTNRLDDIMQTISSDLNTLSGIEQSLDHILDALRNR